MAAPVFGRFGHIRADSAGGVLAIHCFSFAAGDQCRPFDALFFGQGIAIDAGFLQLIRFFFSITHPDQLLLICYDSFFILHLWTDHCHTSSIFASSCLSRKTSATLHTMLRPSMIESIVNFRDVDRIQSEPTASFGIIGRRQLK